MAVIPGPVAYTEGETLRKVISGLIECLAEIDRRQSDEWAGNNSRGVRTYRLELSRTFEKSLDLLRQMEALASYVGGRRAEELASGFSAAADAAVAFRDDPTEVNVRALSVAVVDAIRSSFDLVMLSVAVDTSHRKAVETASEARQAVDARLAEFAATMNGLASAVRQDIDSSAEKIRAETDRLLEEVSARGRETVARTRSAVAGILLNDAQVQFAAAQKWFNWQVGIWACLSVATVGAFIFTTARFITAQHRPATWSWQLTFYAGMRLVLLAGVAAVGSFCLRMLKRQIVVAQLNAHRTRVARSMPGILEIAPESERLVILQSLIRSIVGVHESAPADSNPESLMSLSEAADKILRVKS